MLKKAYGDFQTPPALVDAILDRLGYDGERWPRVVEPTCGTGRFLTGLLKRAVPPREIVGIELQREHIERAAGGGRPPTRIALLHSDIFALDLARDLPWAHPEGGLLVVGNPPWVTSSTLGALGVENRPARGNPMGLRGLDALTGASNFDITEAIWLKLIRELAPQKPTIALLCKQAVARRLIRADLPIARASLVEIDGQRWFGASVSACLMRLDVGPPSTPIRVPVFSAPSTQRPSTTLALVAGRLVSDSDAYERTHFVEGSCPLGWRQGLKHDAAAVMELRIDRRGRLVDKRGHLVGVERDFVFPHLKGGDLHHGRVADSKRRVIVTQRRLGEDTLRIRQEAPALWRHLTHHREVFERRKSSIYKGKPPFSMFGVGDYTFAPYKVAVSGLHRAARFRTVGLVKGQPVMFDDTCYFAPHHDPIEAALWAALLNHPLCRDHIAAVTFADAKRPVTKRLLKRLDLVAIAARVPQPELVDRALSELASMGSAGADSHSAIASRLSILRERLNPPPT